MRADLEKARVQFESELAGLDASLQALSTRWDASIDSAAAQPEKTKIKDEIVALLDRRRYIRNLVRDVNEALES